MYDTSGRTVESPCPDYLDTRSGHVGKHFRDIVIRVKVGQPVSVRANELEVTNNDGCRALSVCSSYKGQGQRLNNVPSVHYELVPGSTDEIRGIAFQYGS